MTIPGPSILIVDDEPQNCRVLEALLHPEGYVTRTASSGAEALVSVRDDPPDLILLDVMMPVMDGHLVAALLKADPATRGIPIIMVTAQTDRAARLAALEAGAEDFLTKPIDRAELWLRVRNHLRLKELTDLLSNHRDHLESQVLARTSELQYLAHYDPLTSLPNRTLFDETLAKTLRHAKTQGWTVGVVFIDLDHFKNINDTLGHALGDELLVQVSRRLVGCVRIRDTVGRFGGDEFALILVMEDGPLGAAAVATKVQDALREPFDLQGREVTVSASIGITAFPEDAADPETLIKYADTAMYEAKQAGRDTFRFFTPEMNTEALARLQLETALRRAIRQGEFVLHYQPKVHVDLGRVAGLEALLRWDRPGHGLVPPGEFIPVLEESGLIVDVGRWVINTVCEQMAAWQRSPVGPRQVAVNVSGRQFVDGDLQGDVLSALEASGIPGNLLELELTESSLMANTDRTIAILEGVKAMGVQISIDDFGTGYSSLAYLRRFPIDKLKIDISFIRDITTDPDNAALAKAIIQMAHSLNLAVVAEGVETEAQLEYLRRHRCDQIQGYLYSRPLSVPDLELLLAAGRCLPVVDTTASPSTLLVIDDDEDMLTALTLLLDGDGYRILTAASAAEGFETLALHEVQVIVCDQQMPGMTGIDFLDRVKKLHPQALRIMLSGAMDDGSLIDTINCGEVYRCYTKPWDAEHLRNDLRDAFRHYWHLRDASHGSRPTPASADLRRTDGRKVAVLDQTASKDLLHDAPRLVGAALRAPAALVTAEVRSSGMLTSAARSVGSSGPMRTRGELIPANEPPVTVVSERIEHDAVTNLLRGLLRVRSARGATELLQQTIRSMGGTLVAASDASDQALPIDVSLGEGPPVLVEVEGFSLARLQVERLLPRLVEDTRQTVDFHRQKQRLEEEGTQEHSQDWPTDEFSIGGEALPRVPRGR